MKYQRDALIRFWGNILCDQATHCWEWQGNKRKGYGRFWNGSRLVPAHRVSYELLVGPLPESLVPDHLCRNPGCVNPSHLEPVTRSENQQRGLQGKLYVECKRGHQISTTNGRRKCLICDRAAKRNHKQRKREKGLCYDCTKPAVIGRTLCETHLILGRERTKRWVESI